MRGDEFRRLLRGAAPQWMSYGVVDAGTEQAPPVRLEGKDGTALPFGPMVSVTLYPSGISIQCRVASSVAGDGEAEYYPFVGGDEVLVALPDGHERAGAVIIGRLNQSLDAWPSTVAGQDATKNVFGFRRMRTPFIVETAAAYLIRSATTGSQIGIDAEGQVILNDGDRGKLTLGPEGIGLSTGDDEAFFTLFPSASEAMIGASTTSLLLASGESKFISQGSISFATAGGVPSGMGVTAEQVVAFVINVLAQLALGGSFTAGPLASAVYSLAPPASCTAALLGVVQPALAALATPTPVGTGGAPGGNFAAFLGTVFGPTGGIALAASSPLSAVDVTGTQMGFGRAGFKL